MVNASNSSPNISKIARYEILREIGRGGMAIVYLARDPNFQREVAIKVLPRDALHDSTLYQRFQREARTIASLEHPAIVPVYDFGEENGQPFLVMRYLSGGSLAAKIKAGPIPVAECAKVLVRIGGALDAAHAKGVVHRDLKPANILFDQYGEAYLSDFGIAQLSEATSPLTGSAVLGTPAYMSPEQIRGDGKVDGRADIYALGVVLFEMLTGKTPFKADTPAQMMMAHLANPTPRLPEEKTGLPDTLNGVLIRAMAKDPEFRFQKASEMGSMLAAIASGQVPVMTETAATNAYFKETSATRIDAEPGLRRKTASTSEQESGSQSQKPSRSRWGLAIAGLVALCLCLIAGSAGGYALYKNPDAYKALLGQKETITSTATPTNLFFPTIEINPTGNITQPNNSGSSSTVDTSALVGDKFAISIGDEISDGVPGSGAGNIETPGSKDIYTFTAEANQSIYLQILSFEMTGDLDMKLIDENDKEVGHFIEFNIPGNIQDWGVIKLTMGGTYTLVVGNDTKPTIGTYKIKIWNVPTPNTFNVEINPSFEISNGVPGQGAGNIETPGVEDIYTLKVAAGASIYIQIMKFEMTGALDMKLMDENDKVVSHLTEFNIPGYLQDWGVVKLLTGGTYTLIMGNDTNPAIGTYKLKLWNVPAPDTFNIDIIPSFEISNGVPGPGAGNIETPGVKDIYTFTATAGQNIYIQMIKYDISGDLNMKLIDEMNKEVGHFTEFNISGYLQDWGIIKLVMGGKYTLTIGNETNPGAGTYIIKIWGAGSPKTIAYESFSMGENIPMFFSLLDPLRVKPIYVATRKNY